MVWTRKDMLASYEPQVTWFLSSGSRESCMTVLRALHPLNSVQDPKPFLFRVVLSTVVISLEIPS